MTAAPGIPRRLVACYAGPLLIIAGLALVSHAILRKAVHDNRGVAAVISDTAHQRALVQQIAELAAEDRLGDMTARTALSSATAAFERDHRHLSRDADGGITPAELHALYFDGNPSLDGLVRDFATDARDYARLPRSDPGAGPALARLLAAARTALPARFDAFLAYYQHASDHRLARLKRLNRMIAAVSVAGGVGVGGLFLLAVRQYRHVTAAQTRLAALVANANDAIIGATLNGVVTDWNPAAEILFGYPATEAVGRLLFDLTTVPAYRSEEIDLLTRVGRGETVPHFATRRRHKDGRVLDVSISMSPIRAPGGLIEGICGSIYEIDHARTA